MKAFLKVSTGCVLLVLISSAVAFAGGDSYKDRANAFNNLCSSSMSNFSQYYSGVSQRGRTITFFVNDSWTRLSRDNREALIKQLYTLWFSMGRVRGLKEDPSDYTLLVKHYNSHRTLATWGAILGYREK